MKKPIMQFLVLFLFLPLLAWGAEPPELSGSNKKAEELSKEDEQPFLEMSNALEGLANDEKDDQKIRQAIDKLAKVIESYPEYSDVYYMRAKISLNLQGAKNYQKIIEDINNAIRFHTSKKYTSVYSNASKYSMRAKMYKEMGNYEGALKDLEIAINTDPDKYYDAIGSSNLNPDDPPAQGTWGKKDFDEIIQKLPKDFRGPMFRGVYYDSFARFDGKNYAIAINDYKKAITLNPKSALCHYFLGKAIQTRIWWNPNIKSAEDYQKEFKATNAGLSIYTVYPQDYKTIVREFSEAIRLDPLMVYAYIQRADVYLTAKKYNLAIKDYNKIIELDPDYGGVYHDRAIAYENLGNYFEAINNYSKAIEAKKKLIAPYSAYEVRADAYIKVADYKNAIEDFTKAIEIQIGDHIGWFMGISQFRAAYSEYDDMTDESLAKKLHKKFRRNLEYDDFANWFLEKK